MGIFSDAQGWLTPQSLVQSGLKFELVRDIMVVLVTCKYEEDPIKNEGARALTRLCVVFSDAQKLTPKSAAEFCLNSNSSKLL